MKTTTFEIAKNELKTLFYSPIAWLIFIIFAFQTGYEFSKLFDNYVQAKATGNSLFSLTERVFTGGPSGLLLKVQGYLYLYIPLLTMGLMSLEYQNDSIKLLYSSPLRNSQIIMGKYIAIMIFSLILIFIVFTYILFGAFTIKELDMWYLLSGLLGLYLLTCAYCAIGLFMSTITSYQIVAAMATLAVLAFLNYVGSWWQDVPVLNDIVYWLSIRGRSIKMIEGLIVSDDVLYFIIVSMLFVILSIMILQGKRITRNRSRRVMQYGIAVVSAIMFGFITSLPVMKLYCDATATKARTLMPSHSESFDRLGKKITLTAYINIFDQNIGYGAPHAIYGLPKDRNNMKARFAQYIRFSPRTKFKYVYYYMPTNEHAVMKERFPGMSDERMAEELATIMGININKILTPEQIKTKIDLSDENWNFLFLLENHKGNVEVLRTFYDTSKFPFTDQVSTAYKRLSGITTKICVVTGHGERNIYGDHSLNYSSLLTDKHSRNSLANAGFDFHLVDLSKNNIPTDTDILLIADPNRHIPLHELAEIAEYIDRGGNMLILGEPGRQEYINSVLSLIGMELAPGRVIQKTQDHDQIQIQGNPSQEIIHWNNSRFNWMLRWRYKHLMLNACEVRQTASMGFTVFPIVTTDSVDCWNELETTDFFIEEAVLNPEAGENERLHAIAQGLERSIGGGERNQRIVVFGDADWMSNDGYNVRKQNINTDNSIIMTEMFKWLTYGDYPIPRDRDDRPRTGDNDIFINPDLMPFINMMLICLLPIALIISFGIIWILRKKK